MQTKVTKKSDFSNHNFYIGLDVHKKSWYVTILTDGLELRTFTQPPSAHILADFLHTNYPGGKFFSAYEAGFCGYTTHRQLINYGINNIVVNPADIPRMNKELVYQTDKSDSRSIARELRNKQLQSIFIFNPQDEEFRSLFRHRLTIAKDIRKACNRIKGFLFYRSISLPSEFDNANWSNRFLNWLENIPLLHQPARIILDQMVEDYRYFHNRKLTIETELRKRAKEKDAVLFKLLNSIPGIGPITAIGLMAEIGDINRFPHIRQFASYVGLVPRIAQSGEKENIGAITYRHNAFLRPLIVEAAWQAVRADPLMLEYYKKSCAPSNSKKAIVKVARKLLSKIMHVMKHRIEYQKNMNV
jgi:transposase